MLRLFLASFIVCYVASAQAQQDTQRIEFHGTVINSATGQPLAGALVVIRTNHFVFPSNDDDKPAPPRSEVTRVVTDSGGRFSFATDSFASYTIAVSRQGFRSETGIDTLTIALSAQSPREVTARLVPLSSIQGRVVNSEGEPLQGITVQVVRIEVRDGRRQLREDASKNTDDRGEYRLWYLSPGSYYLKVVGRRSTANAYVNISSAAQPDDAYGPLYYPNAPGQGEAQVLKVGPGQEISADFSLEGHKALQIRGNLVNIPPNRAVTLRLLRDGDPLGNRSRVNLADGSFAVYDVTPGSYVLQAYTSVPGPNLVGEATVAVGEQDLAGLRVILAGGIDVNVSVESNGPPVPGIQGNLKPFASVTATRVDLDAVPNATPVAFATREQDGRMTLKNLFPGRYEISVQSGGSYVISAVASSVDVLSQGLTVTAGSSPELKIALQNGGTELSGTIDAPPTDDPWTVALFPASGSRPPIIARAFRNAFSTQTIPPGDYNVFAWPSSREIAYRDPSVISALGSYANFITVLNQETQKITLKPIPLEAIP